MLKKPQYKVYKPPEYDREESYYPVLYLFHGRGDNERTWLEKGKVKSIADELISNGTISPVVIVMPYGFMNSEDQDLKAGRYRYPEPSEWRNRIVNQVIPDIKRNYRILAGREHHAIAGVSMGSEQALDLVFSDLSLFSRLGCFSTAFPRQRFQKSEIPERWPELVSYKEGPQLQLCQVSWATGEGDIIKQQYQPLLDELTQRSVCVTHSKFEGEHNWNPPNPWGKCIREFLLKSHALPQSENEEV